MHRKILVMGLPGAGKTTLSRVLAPRLNAVHYNADDVRREINRISALPRPDRVEHARRMGWLCDQVVKTGCFALADFVCPTPHTRAAFMQGGQAFTVWIDRIAEGRFDDTIGCSCHRTTAICGLRRREIRISGQKQVARRVRPIFDPKQPTALFIGRYQPFHDGHKALITEGLERVRQVCIAVRDTGGTSDKNPFDFEYVRARIEHGLREFEGRFIVVPLPNVTHVFYGRDVGYVVERIELDAAINSISATDIRRRLLRPVQAVTPG